VPAVRPSPGILNALANLSQNHGVVQSIVTGNIRQNALSKLKVFEFDQFFGPLDVGWLRIPMPQIAPSW